MTHNCFQIHIVPSGEYGQKKKYRFIAEFADEEKAFNYILHMRTMSQEYADFDIILTEEFCHKKRLSSKVLEIVTAMGEQLPIWEMDFD